MMIIQLFFQKLFLMYILCAIQAKRTLAGRLADYQRMETLPPVPGNVFCFSRQRNKII